MSLAPDPNADYAAFLTAGLRQRFPDQPVYLQIAQHLLTSVKPLLDGHPEFVSAAVLPLLLEPEHIAMFRVPWSDSAGRVRLNRGYRVDFSGLLGPYCGGIRFNPLVDVPLLTTLAFEQTLQNGLTDISIGSAMTGADFDAGHHTEADSERCCRSFIIELACHVGDRFELPWSDIGVGERELGFMYEQYRRICKSGADLPVAVGMIRAGAVGQAAADLAGELLKEREMSLAGKRVVVSGTGPAALGAAAEVDRLGGTVVAMSDTTGFIVDENGIAAERLAAVEELRSLPLRSLEAYPDRFPGSSFTTGADIWTVPAEVALPCAAQHELDDRDVRALVANGCLVVVEGANLALTPDAGAVLADTDILFAPGRLAHAVGNAVAALTARKVKGGQDFGTETARREIRRLASEVCQACHTAAEKNGAAGNYALGADIVAFTRLTEQALRQQRP